MEFQQEKEDPPRIRLLKIKQKMKGKRSLRKIRTIVTSVLKCKPTDLKEFSYKINNHRWRGIIYLKRNNLMGTIFSLWDTKTLIIRGFPKIKYSHDSRVKDKNCICEEKIDGTKDLSIFFKKVQRLNI